MQGKELHENQLSSHSKSGGIIPRISWIGWRLAILISLAMLVKYGVLKPLSSHVFIAFTTYYNAAQSLASGNSPYFFHKDPNIYCYPLFLAILLIPLAKLPYSTANLVWFFSNWIALAVCILVVIFWSKRLINFSEKSEIWQRSLIIILFMISYVPLLYTMYDGQIDLWVATVTLVGIYLARFGRQELAGFFLMIAVLLKLAPLLWLPGFIFLLKRRGILTFLITGILYELAIIVNGWWRYEWYYFTHIIPRWQFHLHLPSFSTFHIIYYWGIRGGEMDEASAQKLAQLVFWSVRVLTLILYGGILWLSWRKCLPVWLPAGSAILLSYFLLSIVELNHLIWIIVPLSIAILERSGKLTLEEIGLLLLAFLLGFLSFELNQLFALWWSFQLALLIPPVISLLYIYRRSRIIKA